MTLPISSLAKTNNLLTARSKGNELQQCHIEDDCTIFCLKLHYRKQIPFPVSKINELKQTTVRPYRICKVGRKHKHKKRKEKRKGYHISISLLKLIICSPKMLISTHGTIYSTTTQATHKIHFQLE